MCSKWGHGGCESNKGSSVRVHDLGRLLGHLVHSHAGNLESRSDSRRSESSGAGNDDGKEKDLEGLHFAV